MTTTIDKIEKLEKRVENAYDKTIKGATANKADREKAKKQYSNLDAQLQKLYEKVDSSDRLKDQWEDRYGCDWEF